MNNKIIAVGCAALMTAIGCDNYSSNGRSDSDTSYSAPSTSSSSREAKKEATQAQRAMDREAARAEVLRNAETALARLQATDPSMAGVLKEAKGYAVFPTVTKGAVGVGGAHGKGVLYEGGMPVGYCDLTQASVGLQVGGQTYSEVIVFSTNDAVNHLKTGKTAFDAQATAVALTAGAGTNAKYKDGVAVFTFDEAGLMVEASIGGQTFSYEPR